MPNAFKVCHSTAFVKSSDGAVEKQCSEDCLNSKNQNTHEGCKQQYYDRAIHKIAYTLHNILSALSKSLKQ